MITFDLFCEDERRFTPHRIDEEQKEGGQIVQTINCLTCENKREEIMFRSVGINMNIKKEIWEAFLKDEGGRGEK
ncbi:MAG: hypothetical protein IMZ52_09580 [Actinobacteria bacterium]|nr:hypothetical protein [Bacteroidota bacterium]MBE3095268.1 hypothetical protein [Actinomycetota bacterium]